MIAEGPAVPLNLAVLRSGGAWVVQAWYHGSTVYEALHPVLVAERRLPLETVPVNCTWETLWHAVALALLDLADGEVSAHYQA
jgi:hypothetical protein